MKKNAYITGSSAITAQSSFNSAFPWQVIHPQKAIMHALEPEYKEFISPLKLRRMNRVVRMGLTSALMSLKNAGIQIPDAIITATGWGCLEDTYSFLREIVEKKEETLSPATFIQSTHNTVGGQIALILGCEEYNNVYVNHDTSFEQALLDAILLIAEGKKNILLGGIDEYAEEDYELKRKAGYWKTNILSERKYYEYDDKGTVPGEGAAFFLLSDNKVPGCNEVEKVFFCKTATLKEELTRNRCNTNTIDLVLSGLNGDVQQNSVCHDFMKTNFPKCVHSCYKNLCGDYDTASAFALWLADQILKTQTVPGYMLMNSNTFNYNTIRRILIHHYSDNEEHTFMLVSKADI